MKKILTIIQGYLLLATPLFCMNYEFYIEEWVEQCSTANACGSLFPACHFAWDANGVCNIAFASFNYDTSNPNAGVIYGFQNPLALTQNTEALIHANYSGPAKIKISYGGASEGYYLWDVPNWNDSNVLYAIAQNMTSACVGNNFDGIDIDFEGTPPAGAGAACAQLIKNIRSIFNNAGFLNKIITLTIPSQTLNKNCPEFYNLVKNLQNPDGSLGYVNHINFMEYCLWIAPGNNIIQQAISDIESYHTGDFKLPYSKMAVGMEQYCCGSTCSTGEFPMDVNSAANLTTWANNKGLAGVFWWDLNKELQYWTPSYCSMSPPPAAFPVSYAIKYACSQPPAVLQLGSPPKSQHLSAGTNNNPEGFDQAGRAQGGNGPN